MNSAIRVISRKSKLALVQVEEVKAMLPELSFDITAADSFGDKNKAISLLDNTAEDFFTREMDKAVLDGRADIAIHSAKDLPWPLPEGLSVIALTAPLDTTDALVSRAGRLAEMPAGSRIGISSHPRISQISQLRPDLVPVSIRGTIEKRIAQVDSGYVDAVVIASCALQRLGLSDRAAEVLPIRTNDLQGYLAVTARSSRADLRKIFCSIDIRTEWGRVSISGAGSGGRRNLTIGVEEILSRAERIFYDDLVDESILDSCVGEKVYVGKRKGEHSSSQDTINELLFSSAKEGMITVRLKGGDPFIFGRGGEESEFLGRRLVSTDILPGVTSAFAAAADAQIPLTMRGISGELIFTSGHLSGDTPKSEPTRVWYMAASSASVMAEDLIASGSDPDTPVASIHHAGSAKSAILRTTLSGLKNETIPSPSVIISGGVANRRISQDRILHTGLDPLSFSKGIPGIIVSYPLITVVPIKPLPKTDLSIYDALILTSRVAAELFFKRWSPSDQKIFAIGNGTAAVIEQSGYQVDYISVHAESESLSHFIGHSGIRRGLYPCSQISSNAIHALSNIDRLDLYTVVPKKQEKLDLRQFSGAVFTSPSAVRAFIDLYGMIPESLLRYAAGPATTRALISAGTDRRFIVDLQEI